MKEESDRERLLRENRELRKRAEYLEDKVAYLEALYSIVTESPEKKRQEARKNQ